MFFLLARGTYTSIDFPGAIETRMVAINASGIMVGRYMDSAGVLHAIEVTPIPLRSCQ